MLVKKGNVENKVNDLKTTLVRKRAGAGRLAADDRARGRVAGQVLKPASAAPTFMVYRGFNQIRDRRTILTPDGCISRDYIGPQCVTLAAEGKVA